jgi:pyruvate dehydrogenase E1 component alpha subunit
VDGQDVRAVREATDRLVERARGGDGPAFLLCNTYRYHGHHVGDVDRDYYRPAEEEQEWRGGRDPIMRLGGWLSEQGIAGEAELQRHNDDVRRLVDNGLAFALDAPFPDVSEVDRHVFA